MEEFILVFLATPTMLWAAHPTPLELRHQTLDQNPEINTTQSLVNKHTYCKATNFCVRFIYASQAQVA